MRPGAASPPPGRGSGTAEETAGGEVRPPPPYSVSFELDTPSPFRLDLTAWALRRRPENAVDRWDGTSYRRVMAIGGGATEVSVSQDGPMPAGRLSVGLSGRPLGTSESTGVRTSLRRLLGLDVDLAAFHRRARRDPRIGPLVKRFLGFTPPRFSSLFECLVNAFACQQLSLLVGIRLLNRLAQAFGPALPHGDSRIYGFPPPEALAKAEPEELRSLGFSHQKAAAIVELSRAVAAGALDLEELEHVSNEEVTRRLRTLRGVGRWSSEYALLRGLGRMDVFPWGDAGARNGLGRWLGIERRLTYEEAQALVEPWRAFGGLLYFHLLLAKLSEQGYVT